MLYIRAVLVKVVACLKKVILTATSLIIQLLPAAFPMQVSYWYCCLGNSPPEIIQQLRDKSAELIKEALLN